MGGRCFQRGGNPVLPQKERPFEQVGVLWAAKELRMAQPIDETVVETIRELLANGPSEEVARLFMESQQRGALPQGPGLLQWIMSAFDPDSTRTLVQSFAHQACVYCTKGLVPCEKCEGKGHIDYTFVCEDCFGLGVRACQFCNGTGWVTWDFVPEGLHVLTLAERTKEAVDSLRARQMGAAPGTARERFLQAVQLLLAINRDMGVLENTVAFSEKERLLSRQDRKVLDAMVGSAVREVPPAEQQRARAVREMIAALNILAQDTSLDEEKRQFEKERVEFYRSAGARTPPFEGTFLRHPFLEDKSQDERSP
jgi:hypothetical protein